MPISDPALALRMTDASAVAVAPLPADAEPESLDALSHNLGGGALYARAQEAPRRWLSLVTEDDRETVEATGEAPEAATTTADLPPFAAPMESVLPTLFDSPAALRELLEAANEHRRVVDILWSAYELGAVQLPQSLASRLERARANWPTVLGPLSLSPLPT
jgi:hypothetical protein